MRRRKIMNKKRLMLMNMNKKLKMRKMIRRKRLFG